MSIFFAKIGIFCKSVDQSNVAIYPSVFQAYTQPYSFGARIKPRITIHEISSSRKKTLDGGPYKM